MNYLFDIGNVLLLLDFPAFEKKIFPDGIPPELWNRKNPYETGQISDREFVQYALGLTQGHYTKEEFIASWNDIFRPHPPMWELVKKLKREGHTLILFSNTNALHAEYFLGKFSVFQHFDHHHFSQEVGSIKPDSNFYTTAIERYHLVPEETIYFDDLPENIATGKALKIRSHQYNFQQHQIALDWLENQISEISDS